MDINYLYYSFPLVPGVLWAMVIINSLMIYLLIYIHTNIYISIFFINSLLFDEFL